MGGPAAPVAVAPVVEAEKPAGKGQMAVYGAPKPPRGADGKFAPKASASAPALEPTEQAARDKMYVEWPEMAESTWGPRPKQDGAPTQEQPVTQDAPPAEAARAAPLSDSDNQVLKLAGFNDAAIAKLAPEDITSIVAAQRTRNADVAAKLAQAAELRKQAAPEAQAEETAETRPLPDDLKALAQELGDEIGSERAGEIVAQLFAKVDGKLAARQEQEAQAALLSELNKARVELGEHLLELRDEAKFRQVLDEVDDLRQTKRWSSQPLAEQIKAAHRNLFPGASQAQLQSDRLQRQGLGSPPPAVTSAPPPRAYTRYKDPFDTVSYAVASMLGDGATPAEAAEEARRALEG